MSLRDSSCVCFEQKQVHRGDRARLVSSASWCECGECTVRWCFRPPIAPDVIYEIVHLPVWRLRSELPALRLSLYGQLDGFSELEVPIALSILHIHFY